MRLNLIIRSLSFGILAFGTFALNSQNSFDMKYPSTADQTIRDVLRTPDGGYIFCGMTNVADPTESDLLIGRTDNNGNMLSGWPKSYGKTGQYKVDYSYSMVETTEGNYLIAGYSASFGGGDIDIYLLGIDPSGTKNVEKTFGGFGFDEAREIIKTSDGNYVITGTSTNGSDQQMFWLKVDKDGTPIGSMQYYGSSAKEFGNAVQETPDGGFIIGGQTFSSDPYGDTYLVKTTSNGTFSWEKKYGHSVGDEAVGIVVNTDGSFVVAIRDSLQSAPGVENIDVRVRKFDANGDVGAGSFDKSYGGASKDTPKGITKLKDGNFLIGAISRSWNWRGNSDPDSPDMWVLKINSSNGDSIWIRNYGSFGHDHCHRAKADPVDNALLLAGHQRGGTSQNMYFLKVGEDGKPGPLSIQKNSVNVNANVFPNPSDGSFMVTVNGDFAKAQLTITNYLGQVVFIENNVSLKSEDAKPINLTGQQPGIYVLNIQSENTFATRKLIIK